MVVVIFNIIMIYINNNIAIIISDYYVNYDINCKVYFGIGTVRISIDRRLLL